MGADASLETPPSAVRPPAAIEGTCGIERPGGDVFLAAVETSRMPMVIADPHLPDTPIVFANEAFLAMTGYGREEVVGRNCRFLQGPQTNREAVAEIARAVAERREAAVEILNYRKDGSTFWNALFVSPVFDADGAIRYFFGSQLDVSRRRDAEDALGQAQKMEALGQLTGGIAHDFNNLLQIILGYVDIVAAGIAKPDADRVRLGRAADNIRNAAERAATLTQQLLAFARKQRLEGRAVNLNHLVESMQELVRRTLGEEVTIETRLSPDLRTCRVDPTQAEVALLNILLNARDAMPGGGRVTIATENRQIDGGLGVSGALGRSFVTVSVTDTGEGIPPEMLARVMDPFFTTKDEGKGTGLGLSMVYGFAKQSGGVARIESIVGQGTTVRLSFPVAERAERPVRRGIAAESEERGSETILVVDDREDVADLARSILCDHGYTVLTATNARQALEVLDGNGEVALLFSDLIMPGGMNGLMLAREARRRRPELRILLTTGYSEASLERTDVGGSEFEMLNKPYRRADLLQAACRALRPPSGAREAAAFFDRTGEIRMPRGDKSKYTDKQVRKADAIAESYESRGVPEKEAEARAWATVNKDDGGGKHPGGSGRSKSTGNPAAQKGGRTGGAASASRSAEERSASAKKAATTRKRNAAAKANG